MLRSVLVDDELESLNALANDIMNHCPDVEVIGRYQSPKEAIKAIHRDRPDVLFLDIDMPFINGFELLEMVHDIDFDVIFVTAYDHYALRAFRISAVDYLLKPVEPEELKAAVNKARSKRRGGSGPKQIGFLIDQIKNIENNTVQKVALPSSDGIEFVEMDRIIYCKSDGAYSYIYLEGGQNILISKTLRFLEDILCDYHFFRVHNSFIINLKRVKKYSRSDGGRLFMDNGDEVRVSRSKKEELLALF
jgi:two-component system LytT family response regulator